jgi:hypothetical protein
MQVCVKYGLIKHNHPVITKHKLLKIAESEKSKRAESKRAESRKQKAKSYCSG